MTTQEQGTEIREERIKELCALIDFKEQLLKEAIEVITLAYNKACNPSIILKKKARSFLEKPEIKELTKREEMESVADVTAKDN